jgi:hypothetical protein
MGGLIILKGLVDRMIQGHAQNAPCQSIRWITLFASPLKGAWTAEVVRIVVGPALIFLRIFRKHLRHLSRGKFVEQLIAETVNRIYKPDASDTCNRRIPIRMILATRDGAVGESNRDETCTAYRNPQPLSLDEDHGSVKEPNDHDDARYRALSVDLQKCLTPKFRALCAQAIDPKADVLDREAALCEITERYGGIIRPRIAEIVGPELYYEAEEAFLLLLAHYAARYDAPPSDVANRSMIMLRRFATRVR